VEVLLLLLALRLSLMRRRRRLHRTEGTSWSGRGRLLFEVRRGVLQLLGKSEMESEARRNVLKAGAVKLHEPNPHYMMNYIF